ncbi:MAG: DNA polymerase III subunit gamma/tau [Eggerthella lenta]
MAEALYRKYRPQIFEDVVGQEHIERTIKNAIEQDKVSHAYLFTGPRGTGKTTTARLLAKALLCECGPTPEPDGTCDDCVMIANGEHPDVYELDAASRTGVENVREEIIGRVQFAPTRGRYKIYIIDEVHMLSTAAFNALLKTLEEPPSHVVFILATTDPQKVPETIHSRCQRFDFRRISAESIVSRLGAICVSEDVEFEGEALDLIAHRAEGGMRNALTSLEQLIAFGEGKVTMEVAERLLGSIDTNDLAEIVRAIGTRDVASCFRWTAEYVETGADLAQFVRDLAEHMRNMYVLSLAGADVALEVSETVRRELASELPLFGPDRLARLLGVLGDLSAELKTSTNPRLSFEIALTRMVRPDSDLTLEALAERIEALESGHSAVAHVIGGGAAAVAAPQVAAASAPQVSVAPAPASPPASPATQGAPMPASQPSAAPASAPGPDRASSAERAGAVPAAPVQPVAAPQVAAPSREAGGVPPQGAEGVSAPRPASPVTQSQAPSAAAPPTSSRPACRIRPPCSACGRRCWRRSRRTRLLTACCSSTRKRCTTRARTR